MNDHLGSVVGTVKRNGTLTSATQYSPYGKIYRRTLNDPSFRHAYTGHELDHELDESWYYYGARYYVPDLCLFSQVDPMTDKYPSLSPFLYCADNPMKYVDEDGRIFWLAAAVGALYYLLSTFDMVQTPTDPQDIHIPSTGEKVLQQAFAIGGAFGAMQFTNWGLSKMAPAATDATAIEAVSADASAASLDATGGAINQGVKGGTSWTTYRRNYWKSEAKSNPNRFESGNLERTKKGLAPQRERPKTGKPESKELHHKKPVREGGSHETDNLQEVWPKEHEKIDKYRRTGDDE